MLFLNYFLAIWMSRIGIILCTYASFECFRRYGSFGSFGWATRLPAAIAELSVMLVVSSSKTSLELFLAVDNWLYRLWYVFLKFLAMNNLSLYIATGWIITRHACPGYHVIIKAWLERRRGRSMNNVAHSVGQVNVVQFANWFHLVISKEITKVVDLTSFLAMS